MTTLAREALTVVSDGEEFPGVIAYGLSARGERRDVGVPRLGWRGVHATDDFTLRGDSWEVVGWEFAFDEWVEGVEWTNAIYETLAAHLALGALVAWVGAEGLPFCDPPLLFARMCMSGGVLA